jgi:PAP2 superfamily
MTGILVTHDILGAADPHGATSLVNLYAAMPSLHVAWTAWCATSIVITTRSRWRHLARAYPAATTLVVLASANHYLLEADVQVPSDRWKRDGDHRGVDPCHRRPKIIAATTHRPCAEW